jgi:2-hydroxychromene-2-carboxylate isomerase
VRARLSVYFDYISPFAYLAAELLPDLAARHDAVLDWKPIEMLSLSAFGKGLPYSPAKRAYVAVDAMRSAGFHGVPIQAPKPFPVQSEAALHLALVAQAHDLFAPLHRALFHAAWRYQRDLADERVLAACVDEVGGAAADWLQEARQPETRERLQALTAEAEDAGVFGVPSVILDGEIFWGLDSLPVLEWRLGRSAKRVPIP